VDLDRLPPGEFRLLPLAFRNLETLGLDDVPFRKAYAIYRQVWLANQLAVRHAAELGARLDSCRIRYALAGDAAVALVAYPDLGTRPIADIAMLVSPDDLEFAKPFGDDQRVLFLSQLAPGATRRFTVALLDAARPQRVGGLSIKVLLPADLFLIASDNLETWNLASRAPAVADAWKLLKTLGSTTDWERLLLQASSEKATLLLGAALDELEALGAGPAPNEFRRRLEAARPGMLERLEYRKKSRQLGPVPGHELSLLVLRHLRARAAGDTQARLPQLPRKIVRHVAWRLRRQIQN
jgi:hypothetical protein